ncbi:hypothetical protein [Bdellovibrio sp.]|uniref:hypothetical protein n=1 Tax=Bdellovibrio sp. TaxID=28201 RepID=UPI0039E53B84
MKHLIFAALVMVGIQTQAQTNSTRIFKNAEGCTVTVEQRRNGITLDIEKQGQKAVVGLLNDRSSGDIVSFCANAGVETDADGMLTLSCDNQSNGGLSTRGQADLIMSGDTLKAVRVIGQVRRMFGWKTDTLIVCESLRERGSR